MPAVTVPSLLPTTISRDACWAESSRAGDHITNAAPTVASRTPQATRYHAHAYTLIAMAKHSHTDAADETYMLTALCRTDFYQTPSSVIASFFLKKIDKNTAKVVFTQSSIQLDLPTADSPPKRYRTEVPLFGGIDPEKTTYKILGTKLEVTLAKAEVSSWPVLRADDRLTGEILQVGRAGKVQ